MNCGQKIRDFIPKIYDTKYSINYTLVTTINTQNSKCIPHNNAAYKIKVTFALGLLFP